MAWKAILLGEGTTLHGVGVASVGSVQHYWSGSCFAGVGAALLRMDAALLSMDRALFSMDTALLSMDATLLRVDAARLILSIFQLCAAQHYPTLQLSLQQVPACCIAAPLGSLAPCPPPTASYAHQQHCWAPHIPYVPTAEGNGSCFCLAGVGQSRFVR